MLSLRISVSDKFNTWFSNFHSIAQHFDTTLQSLAHTHQPIIWQQIKAFMHLTLVLKRKEQLKFKLRIRKWKNVHLMEFEGFF